MDKIRLLMIDDNLDDCELFGRILRHAAPLCEFHALHTAAESFALLDSGAEFDCVLVDYQLADSTGLELLRRLQLRFEVLPASFIMLTGAGSERLVVEAMQAGAFDYLTKSETSPQELVHAVQKASKMTHVRRQLELQHAWREQAEADLLQAQLHSAELAGVRRAVATYLHEINSPLAGIIGYLDMLQQEPHPADLQAAFHEMLSACNQIKHVLRSMEALEELRARPGAGNRGPLDLSPHPMANAVALQERPAQA